MRNRFIVIIIGIFILVSVWVGTASAQDVPGYPVPGYPVETETPTETEVPTKPPETTPEPTQPPQPDPTEAPPTWVPPQPTPTETPMIVLPACPFPRAHPILLIVAERYDVPFEEVADLFCSSRMSINEILMHYQGIQQPNDWPGAGLPEDFPGREGQGWGLYWRIYIQIGFHGNHPWPTPS